MTELRRKLEYLNIQAAIKEDNGLCDIKWHRSIGTSGGEYLWADCGEIRCYLYLTKSGRVKQKTFSINGNEVGYREAYILANER